MQKFKLPSVLKVNIKMWSFTLSHTDLSYLALVLNKRGNEEMTYQLFNALSGIFLCFCLISCSKYTILGCHDFGSLLG